MDATLLFIGLGSASILAALIYRFTFGLRKNPGQTRKTQFIMLGLLGSGLLLISSVQLLQIVLSKHVSVQGTVFDIRRTSGKNAHTDFSIRGDRDSVVRVSASYTGSRLFDGQLVEVTYLDRTFDVTKLRVLDGANAGWTETESGGGIQAGLFFLLSLVLLGLGYRVFRKPANQSPDTP